MNQIGEIYTFKGVNYKLLENNIIPSKRKKRFIIYLNISVFVFVGIFLIPHSFIISDTGFTIGIENLFGVFLALLGYILFIVVHELLHGVSFYLFGGAKKEDITFGLVLKSGMAYCISNVPVTVKGARLSLMMPLYIICIPIYIVAIIINSYWLGVYAILLASGSVGDIYYMWKLRKTNKGLYMYENMPTKSGYEIGYLLFERLQ